MIHFLKALTVTLFLGRAWQHVRWEIPIRSLVWNQELIEPLVNLSGYTWRQFAESMFVDGILNGIVFSIGLFYLLCAIITVAADKKRPWTIYILYAGAVGLASLALLYYMDRFTRIVELMEHATQISVPLVLAYVLKHGTEGRALQYGIKIPLALTFIGHGVYALGLEPVPAGFTTMVMNILPLTENQSLAFLRVAGLADMIVAVLIFIPGLKNYALLYCILWGFLTAFARIVGNFNPPAPMASMEQWLHETLFRIPHGGLPLLLYFIIRENKKIEETAYENTVLKTAN